MPDVLIRPALPDDLPEITELDLNPVVARPDSAVAVDARVRVAPPVARTAQAGAAHARS